ncbi:YaaR family protein [Treponema sp. HNW]|uniref:YaaR family protein n=1 Tax=Treponema sp. HNW TaxID=3116654 RepID=UPI003D139B32
MPGIDPLQSSFFNPGENLTHKKDRDKEKLRVQKSFADVLKRTSEDSAAEQQVLSAHMMPDNFDALSFDDKLTALVDGVYAAGDELKKKPFTDSFIAYKQSLSRFMRFVVDNSYELEIREQRKGKKRRQLITVQTINAKLDELAADILYNQADQLKILAKIDEIHGVLVDFLS